MDHNRKQRFCQLTQSVQRAALTREEAESRDRRLLAYLKEIVTSGEVTDFEEMGFYYWNISDRYGLLKDGHSLFANHQVFYEHVKDGHPRYLYWLVCDATQRLTLEKDGYGEFWWRLYREALEQNRSQPLSFAAFCAHRAALYTTSYLPTPKENFDYAKGQFAIFLQNAKETRQYPFYRTVYLSLAYGKKHAEELLAMCERLMVGLTMPKRDNRVLLGEWRGFTNPFDRRKQAEVGLNSAINAFIENGKKETAVQVYQKATALGMAKNVYIERRL